ncbi:ABC transporter permease [Effusibacillus dendaii]|uniref:UPF0014 membrane protein YjkA n=1 Tax=Effusibacillus dendaii TaxID=2743772 RepID=A0A7I8DH37_9BACL|nr:iron export ABC transporter permease subunit FetB [Effusibacillus dendaii]BCJ88319.1 UPF0014 membrane protein YjkA [Effusibacillus dendaii]
MSLVALSLSLGFIVLALLLSLWLKLGLERDLVIATFRSAIQLLIVGYVLKAVFALQDPIFNLIMVMLMIGVATQNVVKRGKGLRGITWRILAALSLSEAVIQGFLIVFHIVPPTPQYVIPISGMIVGNSMIVAGLLLNRLQSEVATRKQEILLLLSLGGTPKQSIRHVLKEALRASMIPTIDSSKTIGLVQLPGMMTGQIIAGADPIQAVRYQLLIVFSLLAAAALTSIILGFLASPCLFNEHQQLVVGSSN